MSRGTAGLGNARFRYTHIDTASYKIVPNQLFVGYNIFGVNYPGAVSIQVPSDIPNNIVVAIADESGLAGTNNITVTVV